MELADAVRESTSTAGTGPLTLDGPDDGYFAVGDRLADGEEAYFVCAQGSEREVFIGTYDADTNSVSRDEVLASTNNDELVDFAGVAKKLWIDAPARIFMTMYAHLLAEQGIGLL